MQGAKIENEYFPALDGLRGIAALIVYVSHAGLQGLTPQFSFHEVGQLGVMVFFALSGFLMCERYAGLDISRSQVRSFFVSRLSRVVPLYIFVGVFSFVVFNFIDSSFKYDITPYLLLRHLLFVNEMSVFWTIPAEVQFYLLFPAIWLLMCHDKFGGFLTITVLLFASLILQYFDFPGRRMMLSSCLHMFSFGLIVAILRGYLSKRSTELLTGFFPIALSVALLATCAFFTVINGALGFSQVDIWNIGWFSVPISLLVLCASLRGGLFVHALARTGMRWLGKVSYSLYLWHSPVIIYCVSISEHFNLVLSFRLFDTRTFL
jgi:peptidoglycan/LPS O-acetylase OafA/YrhL